MKTVLHFVMHFSPVLFMIIVLSSLHCKYNRSIAEKMLIRYIYFLVSNQSFVCLLVCLNIYFFVSLKKKNIRQLLYSLHHDSHHHLKNFFLIYCSFSSLYLLSSQRAQSPPIRTLSCFYMCRIIGYEIRERRKEGRRNDWTQNFEKRQIAKEWGMEREIYTEGKVSVG